MLTPTEHQRSVSDADQVCESLIPPDSVSRRFRVVVAPLITNAQFAALASPDTGRPAISPALLACATILQFHRTLSDREMARACRYDIEVKYALGLRLDERPFDHSSLGDFRQRLLTNGKEKAIFDRIVQRFVETRLITTNEIQRIDATHILADIAIPTTIALITNGIGAVLKPPRKRHQATLQQLGEAIAVDEYTKATSPRRAPAGMTWSGRSGSWSRWWPTLERSSRMRRPSPATPSSWAASRGCGGSFARTSQPTRPGCRGRSPITPRDRISWSPRSTPTPAPVRSRIPSTLLATRRMSRRP